MYEVKMHHKSLEMLTSSQLPNKVLLLAGRLHAKLPRLRHFEKHLPEDVEIVSCHSLHGPNVDPKGQPLVGQTLSSYF